MTKPLLGVALVLALSCGFVHAQQATDRTVEGSLYYRALVAALAARARDAASMHARDPLGRVLVLKDDQLNKGFPGQVGDIVVEFVTQEDLAKRYRSLKHDIPVFIMRPISNDGDHLVVAFTRYWFSVEKRTHVLSLEGGYRVVLRYDCSTQGYVVESAKLWGI